MGFSEDDRIRAKNRKHNEAYEIYENLKTLGYDNSYIEQHAQLAMQAESNPFRIEVFNTILRIVKGGNNVQGSDN